MADFRTPRQIRAAALWMVDLMDLAQARGVEKLVKGNITKAMNLRGDDRSPAEAFDLIWPKLKLSPEQRAVLDSV